MSTDAPAEAAPQIISLSARVKELSEERGDRPAVTDHRRTVSWGEMHRRTNRIARGLQKAGVKQGDLVTIGLPNSADFIEACYALWKVGATPQPISFRLPQAEATAVMALAETPILIATDSLESPDRPRYDVEALLALSDDESDLPDVTAPIWKAPTSGGSTGRPKLILSGGPGVYNREMPGGYRSTGEDVMLQPGPLYHNGPFTSSFGGLNQGAHLIVMPRFDAEETLRLIGAHKASWIYTVPTMMSRIWRLPEEVRGRYDVSSLKTLWHLAAPCPPWLKEAFIHWLGPDVVMELYAGTEAQAVTIITGTEWLEHRGSVGKVTVGEMCAFDGEGQPLPAGETGEIFMRRPAGAPPSYAYRGATPRTLPGGWESLGDIGWFDEDGYLYLADRRTDMILVGGSNVYPAEIESALDEHPLVQSSAVIGLPDDEMGNTIHAIVQPRPGLAEADLREHLRTRLVTYKQPRTYEFVAENIRDDAGKVRRTQLREERLAKA
ncbi:MAG TPA: AMP-binding protein [Caulobacteraceae bacterium]|jgi:bile acid-coenzyme A ligase|nr:AMP-binding protein [Caulobacteraceae bacterium]